MDHQHCSDFYIDGEWVRPCGGRALPVINPATERQVATISLGCADDVDRAVSAARGAFDSYSQSSVDDRIHLLRRIMEVYQAYSDEMANAISWEMGAPITLSRGAQVPAGLRHFQEIVKVLERFAFEESRGSTLMRKEPIGVCGLITPWNWPMNQIAAKLAPALAAGCTVVLKPSEMAPLSAYLLARILHEAEVPGGVFNLVNGDGPTVGASIAAHPDIDMVSFTGSTRAGVAVAMAAAATVKRVTQELGGKSAFVVLDDADLAAAVKACTEACFRNSGQSCNAPTRLLVPETVLGEAAAIAQSVAEHAIIGDPISSDTTLGPIANKTQFEKVQGMIQAGIDEGATLITGGVGRPQGTSAGYFVKPTVFCQVRNEMRIAREEIFGPVLAIIPYAKEEDAIRMANDTPYGLSSYVSSNSLERARCVAKRLRAGNVHINGARLDFGACFGGYKQSGNGREWGAAGLQEYLELKAVFGHS